MTHMYTPPRVWVNVYVVYFEIYSTNGFVDFVFYLSCLLVLVFPIGVAVTFAIAFSAFLLLGKVVQLVDILSWNDKDMDLD